MNRLFVPTLGPADWRRLLADPVTQWERYKSALEMAVCWDVARDLQRGVPLFLGWVTSQPADLERLSAAV